LTRIEDVVVRREFVEQAERALLTRRNQLGVDPERTHASAVACPTQAIFTPETPARRVRTR